MTQQKMVFNLKMDNYKRERKQQQQKNKINQ